MSQDRLLTKQSFDQLVDDGARLVSRMKRANDELQSFVPKNEGQVKKEISQSKSELSDYSKQFKDILQVLEKQAIVIIINTNICIQQGFDQKSKVKKLKEGYQKEVGRNKNILEDLINWQFDNKRQSIIQTRKSSLMRPQQPINRSNGTQYFEELQDSDDFDRFAPQEQLELDQMIIKEKQEELNALEKDTYELNKVVADISKEVGQQDIQLDLVVDNQIKTKDNLVGANMELDAAKKEQKQFFGALYKRKQEFEQKILDLCTNSSDFGYSIGSDCLFYLNNINFIS